MIPVGFGYGDGDEFFLWGWVWDSETRPRPDPLPSLRRCIVIAKFCIQSLHLLHANVVSGAEFQLMHGGGWVEVDVVGEGAEFESECHALRYHFLIEVWCAKGSLTETVNESLKHLILFLSDTEK